MIHKKLIIGDNFALETRSFVNCAICFCIPLFIDDVFVEGQVEMCYFTIRLDSDQKFCNNVVNKLPN